FTNWTARSDAIVYRPDIPLASIARTFPWLHPPEVERGPSAVVPCRRPPCPQIEDGISAETLTRSQAVAGPLECQQGGLTFRLELSVPYAVYSVCQGFRM